jgi:DNA-binding response OmpR family regulator
VEDEHRIAELLVTCFEREGYACEVARDGLTGLRRAQEDPPDLLLLDLMLPGMDGLSLCRKLRETQETPVLMLTARDQEMDKVLGLELGADDYVTKPFSLAELKARVRSLLRRSQITRQASQEAEAVLDRGDLHLDHGRREVTLRGCSIELTAREFDLLAFLMAHPGQVFSREQLLEKVWEYGHEGYGRTVDSHVTRLRKKIEEDPSSPTRLQTVWGVGYRFRAEG